MCVCVYVCVCYTPCGSCFVPGGPLAHLAIGGTEPDINLTVIEADDHFSFDPQSRNISVVKELWISREADKRRQMTIGCTIVKRNSVVRQILRLSSVVRQILRLSKYCF